MVITVGFPGSSLTRPSLSASHWGGLEVAELEVGPGGGRGLAQQQDGEQQQQQQAQDRCWDQWVPSDPGGRQSSP